MLLNTSTVELLSKQTTVRVLQVLIILVKLYFNFVFTVCSVHFNIICVG